MRVFITGYSGLLGSAIRAYHESLGSEVSGCDIAPNTPAPLVCDIRDTGELSKRLCRFKPHRVYHCAAMLGVENTERFPDVCRDINEQGTESVMRACVLADVEHLIFLSSSEVYGGSTNGELLTEQSPLNGDNVYARGKRIGEETLLARSRDLKITVCRMFNCYGPRQTQQFFIPKTIARVRNGQPVLLYGNPGNRRCYLFSLDAAIHIENVARNAPSGAIVNVTATTPSTLHEVATEAYASAGIKPNIILQTNAYDDRTVARDVPERLGSDALLTTFSTYKPYTTLSRGIGLVNRYFHESLVDWPYERRTFP